MPRPRTRAPKLLVFDQDTGEEVRYRKDTGRGQQKQRTGGYWVRFYPEQLWRLTELRGADVRLFLALVRLSPPNAPLRFSVTDVAEALGTAPSTISRSVRNLKYHGILIEREHRNFWLDPHIVWRGSDDVREKTLAELGLSSTLDTTSRKDADA